MVRGGLAARRQSGGFSASDTTARAIAAAAGWDSAVTATTLMIDSAVWALMMPPAPPLATTPLASPTTGHHKARLVRPSMNKATVHSGHVAQLTHNGPDRTQTTPGPGASNRVAFFSAARW